MRIEQVTIAVPSRIVTNAEILEEHDITFIGPSAEHVRLMGDKIEAKVRTEARFAYDHKALYVAVKVFDPDMDKLRAPFARRDNVLTMCRTNSQSMARMPLTECWR